MKKVSSFLLSVILFLFLSSGLHAQVELDIETGVVFNGYNDVRIPGSIGTKFSLSKDFSADPGLFYRIRLIYNFNERHHVGALFAPLSIKADGRVNRDLYFKDTIFPAQTPLKATYKFNSYRLFYRYDLLLRDRIKFGLGFTAKIRDAKIAVQGNGMKTEKTNVGFVPLIHFRLIWKFSEKFSLLIDGDALAAPQGRAEDVLTALLITISPKVDLKAGYRIVEGGADNDEVYNFALINYALTGLIIHF